MQTIAAQITATPTSVVGEVLSVEESKGFVNFMFMLSRGELDSSVTASWYRGGRYTSSKNNTQFATISRAFVVARLLLLHLFPLQRRIDKCTHLHLDVLAHFACFSFTCTCLFVLHSNF